MPDDSDPSTWASSGRGRILALVESQHRAQWLANQIDALEQRMVADMGLIEDRLKAIQAGQAKILWAVVGVLISLTTGAILLALQGAIGS